MQQRYSNLRRQKIQRDQKLEYENFRNSKLISLSKEYKLTEQRLSNEKIARICNQICFFAKFRTTSYFNGKVGSSVFSYFTGKLHC